MSHKNPEYLAWVRTLPCISCGYPHAEPHHIIGVGAGIMGGKASDIHTMPLCRSLNRDCHNRVHEAPDSFPQVRWMMETQDQAISEGFL